MAIFNSLGSNYDFGLAVKMLFGSHNPVFSKQLKSFLEKKYQGPATLLYKGREAIFLALKTLNLPAGSQVAITGYTCLAVYQAVKEAGLEIVYLDIDDSLNFSAEILSKYTDVKVVIVQNTLGNPADVESIERICKEKNIILIEDLAHCIGTKYKNGKEAGTVGDMVCFSFSQDKVIDSVSGGALVVRNSKYVLSQEDYEVYAPRSDRWYPLLTWIIRNTYDIGLGKVFHSIFRRLNLLPKPVVGNEGPIKLRALPHLYAKLILDGYEELADQLKHKTKIAEIYSTKLNKTIQLNINQSINLRYPILVENRNDLINLLKQEGVYISDIWYDAPIAPAKYTDRIEYNHECPNSENISAKMLNLPTHRNISISQAENITKMINSWLESK